MKKLFVLAAICAVSSIANAGWLYWQVGGDSMSNVMGEAEKQEINWNYARFYAVDGENKTLLDTLYNAEYVQGQKSGFDYSTGVVEIDMANWSSGSYSFYIEFVNAASAEGEASNLLGYGTETYAGLSGSVQTTRLDVGQPIPESAKWHAPSGGYNAPEPTSAMLMLLGVAGLALKRKQKKA